MTKEQAQFLVKVTQDCGNQDVELREDYSGRYMFGKTTYGVVIDSVSVLLVDCLNYLRESYHPLNKNPIEIPDFEGFNQDNMGMGTILY